MTYEQFLAELEELKQWISKRDRPATSWFSGMADWAAEKYGDARTKEMAE